MKVCSCPWCGGKGRTVFHDYGQYINEPGAIAKMEFRPCEKCEGSGVIAYKAVLEIESGLEPAAEEKE
jgi:hypothetical protein